MLLGTARNIVRYAVGEGNEKKFADPIIEVCLMDLGTQYDYQCGEIIKRDNVVTHRIEMNSRQARDLAEQLDKWADEADELKGDQ